MITIQQSAHCFLCIYWATAILGACLTFASKFACRFSNHGKLLFYQPTDDVSRGSAGFRRQQGMAEMLHEGKGTALRQRLKKKSGEIENGVILESRCSGYAMFCTLPDFKEERGSAVPTTVSWFANVVSGWLVPKSQFWHFYYVGIIVSLLSLGFQIFFSAHGAINLSSDFSRSLQARDGWYYWNLFVPFTPNILFLLHSTRRLLEQLFVVESNSASQMHVFAYLLGISFYAAAPLSLAPDIDYDSSYVSIGKMYTTCFFILLFVLCNALQYDCHRRLASLRRQPKRKRLSASDVFFYDTGASKIAAGTPVQHCAATDAAATATVVTCVEEDRSAVYEMPFGGLFEFMSCPHYFLEMLLYLCLGGIVVIHGMGQRRLPSVVLCTLFVWITMIANGTRTHEWYLKHLGDSYPRKRKALLPLTW
eukprot:GHVQ01003165.1.p1 GENE.GHVQ01003165.1~~GHVQ01003165.1.p1  ORF type:complete len:422 (-),score=31.56 GHVQ01003165.1:3108-4373(-)